MIIIIILGGNNLTWKLSWNVLKLKSTGTLNDYGLYLFFLLTNGLSSNFLKTFVSACDEIKLERQIRKLLRKFNLNEIYQSPQKATLYNMYNQTFLSPAVNCQIWTFLTVFRCYFNSNKFHLTNTVNSHSTFIPLASY